MRIILYKEVEKALILKSIHAKHALEKLHPNIRVMRHPDHTALEGASVTLFWAHHEKLCLIDRRKAFMGGIDLCFGRWDLNYHPIADLHPDNLDAEVFNGQEYNNVRIQDFNDIDRPFEDGVDRAEIPRMGWHDVALQINGPACVSLERHFIERWEFLRVFKYLSRPKYIPMVIGVIEHEAIRSHGHLDKIQEKLKKLDITGDDDSDYKDPHSQYDETYETPENDQDRKILLPNPNSTDSFVGPINAQLCRSVCDWSIGFLLEKSIQNAYIGMIRDSKYSIYMENQFFIAGGEQLDGDRFHNRVGDAIVERILRAASAGDKFRVMIVIPAIPGFPGDIKGDDAIGTRAIMNFQYKSINRGGNSIIERIAKAGHNPADYIQFFNLRSFDRILPRPDSDLFKAVSYDQTSGEMAQRSEKYAQDVIASIKNGSKSSISDLAMQGCVPVSSQGWAYKSNEADHIVSELLYIHSKLIIVDDNVILCGSANINDRSLAGDHDSEICMVLEEPQNLDTVVNGKYTKVSRLASSMRRQLMRKHLGLVRPQSLTDDLEPNKGFRPAMSPLPAPYEYDFGSEEDKMVEDFLSDDLWNYLRATAKGNEAIFEELFHCYPTNQVRNWKQYVDYLKDISRPCHLVNKYLEDPVTVKQKLDGIKGYIIPMAHEFLIEEKELVKSGIQYNDYVSDIYA